MNDQTPPEAESAVTEWGVSVMVGNGARHVIQTADRAHAEREFDRWPQADRSIVSRVVTAWTPLPRPVDGGDS